MVAARPSNTGKKAPSDAPTTPNRIFTMKTARLPRSMTAAIPPNTMPMSSISISCGMGNGGSWFILGAFKGLLVARASTVQQGMARNMIRQCVFLGQ